MLTLTYFLIKKNFFNFDMNGFKIYSMQLYRPFFVTLIS